MNSRNRRLISILLLIAFFISTIPTTVIAEEINKRKVRAIEPVLEKISKGYKAGKILSEVEEKREKNVKYFLRDDYTYEAAVYPDAVHYKENGKWKDIDNSLIEGTDESNNPILENKANDLKIKIAKKSDAKKLVSIKKDNYEVSWGIIDGQFDNVKTELNSVQPQKIEKDNSQEDMRILSNITSTVQFDDIYPNVDLEYITRSEDIKETLILKSRIEGPVFKFDINTKNLAAILKENNTIAFYDINDNKKEVFLMDAPYMVDANNVFSDAIEVSLEQINKGYTLTLKPNAEWLNNQDRSYPVKIDPTVGTSTDVTEIYDGTVKENYPTSNYYNYSLLQTGYGSTSGRNRSYMKFTLPSEITTGDLIVGGYLNLNLNQNTSVDRQVNAYRVPGDWQSTSITWNNQPITGATDLSTLKVEDYQMVQSTSNNSYIWNVTKFVREWYTTGNNFGIMLQNENEDPNSGYVEFISSDISGTYEYLRPLVVIQYVNHSGLEGYWTYHSQSVGRAGTGYVNDNNGNLVFTHDGIATGGLRMPVAIGHIFNSNDRGTDIGYGNGWRLNLSQRVENKTIGLDTGYEYTDEDGTRHFLKYNTTEAKYIDESGLNISMTIDSGSTLERYVIKDKSENMMKFTSSGYLYKIVDRNGNEVTLSYSGAILYSVTDGSGKVVQFTISNGKITEITDTAGRKISYVYTGNNLTKIDYPDGKESNYTYDGNNNLLTAENFDGYKITYEYYDVSPYKVKKISERGKNDNNQIVDGNYLELKYGYNTTTFTDNNQRQNIYQYNDFGNTKSVRDNNGNAFYYDYGTEGNETNKLKLSSKLQKPIMNYLKNHNAETNDVWLEDKWGNSTGSASFDNTIKYIGNQSLKVNKTNNDDRHYMSERVTLEKGKDYNFSAYVRTEGVGEGTAEQGAAIFLTYQDSTGAWQTVESNKVSGTTIWQRYEVTLNLPSDAVSNTVYARVGIIGVQGTAYFDALQLEDGTLANRYNLLENNNLTYGETTPEYWVNNLYMESSDILTTITDDTYPSILGNDKKILKIDGKADKHKGLYQKVNVSGDSGDVFVISGWGKADSVLLTQDTNVERRFALCVGIERNDGTFQWDFKSFNEDYSEWQYVSGMTIADSAYKSVYYFVLYYENENLAYFDGLQLYKEVFGQSYTYDDEGNIVSSEDLAKSDSTFEYSTENELIKTLTPKGGEFTYTYDDNHNVLTATTSENVVSTFTYDQHGNPIKTHVAKTTSSLFIESEALYSSDGNYIESVKDPSGNIVRYIYNKKRDNLDVVIDSEGNSALSIYDEIDTLVENYGIDVKDKREVFPLKGSTTGSKGTVPIADGSIFVKDEYGEEVLNITEGNLLTYDFSLTQSSGLMSMFLKTSGTGTRYLISSGGSDYEMLNIYIDGDNKVNAAVRGTDNSWNTVVTTEDVINKDQWYSLSVKWELQGNTLYIDLFLNGIETSGNTTNFKDFSNLDVTIGSYVNGSYPINGNIDQFIYSSEVLSDNDTTKINTDGRGSYLEENYVGNKYTYEDDKVKSIKHNDVIYNFSYDAFGNVTEVKVGNQSLIQYTYETDNAKLTDSTYGNGNSISYKFDDEERVIGYKFNSETEPTYEYEYDANGNLGRHKDNENGITYRYLYDLAGRLGKVVESQGNSTVYNYDIESNLESIVQKINNNMYTTSYIYDKDNKLTDINYGDNKITCTYGDDLERLKKKSISSDGGATSIYDVTYSYESGKVTNSTTNRISEISNNGATLQYTYDSFGNIKTVTDSNNKIIQYFYNYLNELVRENNKVLDKTIIYSYDKGGNILSKREYEYTTAETPATLVKEYTYQYDDVWKDKLTSFDGKGITYDAIGNPLTYDNYAYTWQKGRQLATMKHNDNGIDISYKYNASGIRTEKKVVENSQTVTTKYLFEGDKVVYESNGTDNIYYTYSLGAKLVSMNLNDIEYFYIRNTQGDIIALIDDKGDEVVKYTYDSWGKLISIKDKDDIDVTNDKTHVGYKNPYRYRGYRYDTETQLYYLDSRYYNPEWGRFINSDNLGGKIGDLLSHNVFAYCKNNPVNMSDPSGHWPKWAKWAVVAVAVVAVVAVAIVAPEVIPAIATAVSNAYYSLGAAATVASWRVSKAVKPVVQRATGAFSSGATGVGNGLGVLKDKAINVTKKGLDIVKKHLSTNNFAEFPENQAMVSRLETAVSNGTKITGADASFYMHELAESTMMKNGMAYNLAHAAALEKYGVSPFSVYHQDIIKIMPEIFNSNWRKFWEGN